MKKKGHMIGALHTLEDSTEKKIIYKPLKKKFSIKQLYNLWIEWVQETDINIQDMFRRYNLKGSFVKWLENKTRDK